MSIKFPSRRHYFHTSATTCCFRQFSQALHETGEDCDGIPTICNCTFSHAVSKGQRCQVTKCEMLNAHIIIYLLVLKNTTAYHQPNKQGFTLRKGREGGSDGFKGMLGFQGIICMMSLYKHTHSSCLWSLNPRTRNSSQVGNPACRNESVVSGLCTQGVGLGYAGGYIGGRAGAMQGAT